VVSVSWWVAVPILLLFVAVIAGCTWAIRYHNRMFPKGFDRTGWNPDGERAGWFMTKFTWLSGGRGTG
jgi:hypothetical protein